LDAANGVTFNGFVIPAISSRRAETDVELGEAQSVVVAGLLDNRDTESFSKLPFLGDIPVLGTLFKSKTVKKSRTDLVMLVTPDVTQPLGPNDPRPEIAFPKDFLVHLTQADMQNAKSKADDKQTNDAKMDKEAKTIPPATRFDITGTPNIPVVVEGATDLAHGAWVPLQSLGLTKSSQVRLCKAGEPCIVQVRSTRIGLSRAVAGCIFVIPETPRTR
jgi:Fe2+ transport system protein FeoA